MSLPSSTAPSGWTAPRRSWTTRWRSSPTWTRSGGHALRLVLRPKEERIGDLSDIRYIEPLPGQKKPKRNHDEGEE